jgi:hypothetical protein
MGYCRLLEALLIKVDMTTAIMLPRRLVAMFPHEFRCELLMVVDRRRAVAPAGGWVTPSFTMAAMANAAPKLCRSHTGTMSKYDTDTAIVMDTTWPKMTFRGCEAGAAVSPYRSVMDAPKGLRNKDIIRATVLDELCKR